MPLYEYECSGCHHKFETLVRGTEQPTCPKCGSAQVEKCLSVFAVSTKSTPAPMSAACGACPHAGNPGGCGMAH